MNKFYLLLILFAGCSHSPAKNYTVQETPINTSKFITAQKRIDYANRFQLTNIKGVQYLVNISKDKKAFYFNLLNGELNEVQLDVNIFGHEIDAVNYNKDTLAIVANDKLYTVSISNNLIDSICNMPLQGDEFTIHNMYSQTLYKYDNWSYFQYGNTKNYNRVDSNAVIFFNKEHYFKKFTYPKDFSQYYIHYNDMCITSVNKYFYYAYATAPFIYKASIQNNSTVAKEMDTAGFLKYDTSRLTDMKYVYDYTMETKYNVKLLSNSKFIFLIQRQPKKFKTHFFNLLVFDLNLNLLSNRTVDHYVDPNFIFTNGEQLIFISMKDKKEYTYAFQ